MSQNLVNDYWKLQNLRDRWGDESNPITWVEFFDSTTQIMMNIIEKIEKIDTGKNDESQGT